MSVFLDVYTWCGARPHVWIPGAAATIVFINGLVRKTWPTMHEAVDLIISFVGIIGGCAVLKDAFSKTEAEMGGLAWPIVIGGFATVWISGKNFWDRIQNLGSKPVVKPTPVKPAPPSPGDDPPAK